MSLYVALGIAIGILIAVWTWLSAGTDVGLVVWAGIVAWGAFFAAGGGLDGFKRTVAANLAGNLWAFLALFAFARFGGGSILVLALLVGLIAFMMCVEANVPLLSFIPGAFLGAATWVGAAAAMEGGGAEINRQTVMIPLSMILGALFGYLSEALAKKFTGAPARAEV